MKDDSVYSVTIWMLLQCCHLDRLTTSKKINGTMIHFMSDRVLNHASLLLELRVPVLDELASLLEAWGVEVVVWGGAGPLLKSFSVN